MLPAFRIQNRLRANRRIQNRLQTSLRIHRGEDGSVCATSSAWCSTVAFSEKGDLVAAVSYDKIGRSPNQYDNVTLQVWELPTGTERLRVRLSYKLSLARRRFIRQIRAGSWSLSMGSPPHSQTVRDGLHSWPTT